MARPIDESYRTLGILRGAETDEIRAAHRRLAKRFHPDGSMGDEQRFLAVQEAYQLLSDPMRRRDWDRRHAAGPMLAQRPPARPTQTPTPARPTRTRPTRDGSHADGSRRRVVRRRNARPALRGRSHRPVCAPGRGRPSTSPGGSTSALVSLATAGLPPRRLPSRPTLGGRVGPPARTRHSPPHPARTRTSSAAPAGPPGPWPRDGTSAAPVRKARHQTHERPAPATLGHGPMTVRPALNRRLPRSAPPMTPRCRIAPSPTGPLHIGTARTALFNFLFARQHGGTFILRLEDTDQARSTLAYERDILDGLHWLGLEWDEGPEVAGQPARGPYGPYRQSERTALYAAAIDHLLAEDRAYPCFCTTDELAADREAQQKAKQDAAYVGRCASLTQDERAVRRAEGRPAVIRFRVGSERVEFDDLVRGHVGIDTSALGGDLVIARSDGSPAVPLRGRRRRHRDAHQPRHPRRGPPLQHAQARAAVPRPRRGAARLRPPAAHPQPGPVQDEQAQEPDRHRRLSPPGLRARGHRQPPGPPGLVERLGRGGLQHGGPRGGLRPGPRPAQRRHLRPGQARLAQRAVDPPPAARTS